MPDDTVTFLREIPVNCCLDILFLQPTLATDRLVFSPMKLSLNCLFLRTTTHAQRVRLMTLNPMYILGEGMAGEKQGTLGHRGWGQNLFYGHVY